MYRSVKVEVECPICGEVGTPKIGSNGANAAGICPSCWDAIPGWSEDRKFNYLHHCEKHDHWYFTGSNQESAWSCPKCRIVTCPVCGEDKPIRIDKAGRANPYGICESCWEQIPGWDGTARQNILRHCEEHGTWWFVHSNASKEPCTQCAKEASRSLTARRYLELASLPESVVDEEKRLIILPYEPSADLVSSDARTYGTGICVLCGREFVRFGPRSCTCGCCVVWKTCAVCGERYAISAKHSLDAEPSEPAGFCSPSCAVKHAHDSGSLKVAESFVNADHAVSISADVIAAALQESTIKAVSDRSSWKPVTAENAGSLGSGCWVKLVGEEVVDAMATSSIAKEHAKIAGWLDKPTSEKYAQLAGHDAAGELSFAVITEEPYEDALITEMLVAAVWEPVWWKPSPAQIAAWKQLSGIPERKVETDGTESGKQSFQGSGDDC